MAEYLGYSLEVSEDKRHIEVVIKRRHSLNRGVPPFFIRLAYPIGPFFFA
ncbi:hypothetical protein N752_19470 [Desulforamulus aquiferis]|nr:hypothetical protein N752_19470 [Desulforamulus aquiferis]